MRAVRLYAMWKSLSAASAAAESPAARPNQSRAAHQHKTTVSALKIRFGKTAAFEVGPPISIVNSISAGNSGGAYR